MSKQNEIIMKNLKLASELNDNDLRLLFKSLNKKYIQLDKKLDNKDQQLFENQLNEISSEMDLIQERLFEVCKEIEKRELRH